MIESLIFMKTMVEAYNLLLESIYAHGRRSTQRSLVSEQEIACAGLPLGVSRSRVRRPLRARNPLGGAEEREALF